MEWYFTELRKHKEPFQFDETMDLEQSLIERFPDVVIKCSPISFKGVVTNDRDSVIIDAEIGCELTVPSSRSLTPVHMHLDFTISEIYVDDASIISSFPQEDVVMLVQDDKIDVDKLIEDNVVLQVPMQVLTPEEEQAGIMPSGSEWQVISEADDESEQDKPVDPRLAKLQDLFNDKPEA
ncbi:DUF177 domain-containing protein [Pediococcus stilesii]|uniref:DUF177 domain-containing protein n=1 Tax=Pediococcus stilesii TaxID=331679 RepID=A0A5R9BVK2_9LACO|nr:DUF177 domain-containing protein [Pediococcus stilesii]TLQ04679.1 DUF177 domain-containing protein [Pediococcus stilesii]